MFSISFGEMLVIALVCLVIVGPARLPRMARYCGHLFGKINRQAAAIKRDIRREMDIEDLRQAKLEAEQAANEIEETISTTAAKARQQAKPGMTSSSSVSDG